MKTLFFTAALVLLLFPAPSYAEINVDLDGFRAKGYAEGRMAREQLELQRQHLELQQQQQRFEQQQQQYQHQPTTLTNQPKYQQGTGRSNAALHKALNICYELREKSETPETTFYDCFHIVVKNY